MQKIPTISVVTPTFRRPVEVLGLLENICEQTLIPSEVILIDGAPSNENATEGIVRSMKGRFPFDVVYIRHSGGTAVQRNHGIDVARGNFVAFVDDDVRLEPGFFKSIVDIFDADNIRKVGGVVGYRTNEHFDSNDSQRWRWYKRLRLLSTFEPGRYDFKCGYPINNSMQPPFTGTRSVDFMTTACAVWRREVFDGGARFHDFFRDYGVLEDAHFSLKAARRWTLLQCGDAQCVELRSPNGRVDQRQIGYKCVANYYFVFRDIVGPLGARRAFRFWRYQAFEFFRIAASALRRRQWGDVRELRGRIEGAFRVARGI